MSDGLKNLKLRLNQQRTLACDAPSTPSQLAQMTASPMACQVRASRTRTIRLVVCLALACCLAVSRNGRSTDKYNNTTTTDTYERETLQNSSRENDTADSRSNQLLTAEASAEALRKEILKAPGWSGTGSCRSLDQTSKLKMRQNIDDKVAHTPCDENEAGNGHDTPVRDAPEADEFAA
jgi:hypothetical protein